MRLINILIHLSQIHLFIVKGCVTLTLGNSRYQANEQDVLYFRANEIHQLHNETTDEIEILIVATASYL